LFPWQLWQFVQPIPILLAYLVPLDVDVIGNITAKFVKFGVNLTFFAAAIAMVTKVQKMLNSLQISQIFAVMLPVTPTSSGTR
jgi:uncharacterized membrane protein